MKNEPKYDPLQDPWFNAGHGTPQQEEPATSHPTSEYERPVTQNQDKGESGVVLGCLVVLGLMVWGIWSLVTGCWVCSESFLTKSCAKTILQSTCGQSREINDVISIDDVPGVNGTKQVVYEFKKIPMPGTVESANPFRATTAFGKKALAAWIITATRSRLLPVRA